MRVPLRAAWILHPSVQRNELAHNDLHHVPSVLRDRRPGPSSSTTRTLPAQIDISPDLSLGLNRPQYSSGAPQVLPLSVNIEVTRARRATACAAGGAAREPPGGAKTPHRVPWRRRS